MLMFFHVRNKLACGPCIVQFLSVDDFSRVKLEQVSNQEGSDYINASYIDVSGERRQKWQTSIIFIGLWETKCIYCSTGPTNEHNRRFLEDDMGTQARGCCHGH